MSRNDSNRIVAQNIRSRRRALGYAQDELADRAGIHRTYIGAIERGKRNITLDTLDRIAKALGCETPELFDERGT